MADMVYVTQVSPEFPWNSHWEQPTKAWFEKGGISCSILASTRLFPPQKVLGKNSPWECELGSSGWEWDPQGSSQFVSQSFHVEKLQQSLEIWEFGHKQLLLSEVFGVENPKLPFHA